MAARLCLVGLQLGIREKAGQGVRDSKVSFDFFFFFLRNLVTNFSLSGWLSVPVPWTRGRQRWRRPSYCIVFELKFDMRGGGVLLLTSQHLPQHHLPALLEEVSFHFRKFLSTIYWKWNLLKIVKALF